MVANVDETNMAARCIFPMNHHSSLQNAASRVARWGVDRRSEARAVELLVAGILVVLVLAPLPVRAEVFEEPLCERLPEVKPEVKSWVAQVAPELAQLPVRALPEKTALDVFRRAAAAGWGSIDVLTHDVFREPCTFHFSRQALRAVDANFALGLLPPMRGRDTEGQVFEMASLLAGRGELVVFYDRDGITYWDEEHGREFELASRVEFDTTAAGTLENIRGCCAKVFLVGCVRVRSMVKTRETLEVRAGPFTSRSPLKPIRAREDAPEAGRGR